MAAMFSQNPLMDGPNYSYADVPKTNNGEPRQHGFNPYVKQSPLENTYTNCSSATPTTVALH